MKRELKSRTITTDTHRLAQPSIRPARAAHAPPNLLLRLQRTIGNRAIHGILQTRIKIGQPEDGLKRHTDRAADQIVEKTSGPGTVISQASSEPALNDPQSIRERLGRGHSLDSGARSRLEAVFGISFARVQLHTDAEAAKLSHNLKARAFTVGEHIAFGANEYRPGTPVGDTLIAHELAHVVQQDHANTPAAPRLKGDTGYNVLEEDANLSTASAVASLWTGAKGTLVGKGRYAGPRRRSGLRLQRCDQKEAKEAKVGQRPTKVIAHGASADAVKVASERMNEVFSSLQSPGAGELQGKTVELHIIPHNKKLTDLPEFASLKGKKTFDGRNYDDLRGVGGTKVGDTIRYAVAEEQLISIPGKPSGYAKGFVAAHESGHIVEQFGLTDAQKEGLKKAYEARKAAGGPWLSPASYTSSNVGEYFAQSTSAYFGRPYSDSDEDKKSYTREWLQKNDAAMHKLLTEIYK